MELLRRGHSPSIYSPRLGELAGSTRMANIPVVDDLSNVVEVPDLIHGQHHLETMAALSRFPDTPAVLFCHGVLPWESTPVTHPRILLYVAMSEAIRDRINQQAGIDDSRIRLLQNFVDLARFQPRATPLPDRPQRALIFSNYATEGDRVETLRQACALQGISLDIVGRGYGTATETPESVLGNYDIVFARGRAALESLAAGAAVICCDIEGAAPMVTTGNLDWFRRNNFGFRTLSQPVSLEYISEQIARYDAADATQVSVRIRQSAGLEAAMDQILEIYDQCLQVWARLPAGGQRLASEGRAMADYLTFISRSASNSGRQPELAQLLRENQELRIKLAAEQSESMPQERSLTWRIRQGLFRRGLPRRTPFHLRLAAGWFAVCRRHGADGQGAGRVISRPFLVSFCNLRFATTSPLLYLSLPIGSGAIPVMAPVSLGPHTMTDNATGLVMSNDRIFVTCSSERGFVIAVLSARDLTPIAQHIVPHVRDVHSICVSGDSIYVVSTATDEVWAFEISRDALANPKVVWKASNTGRDTHHLNSIVEAAGDLMVSAFGPKTDGSWNSATNGYIHNISRDLRLMDGIYHPHTLSVRNKEMYYCESRNRTFCSLGGPLFRLDGYSRGVTWLSDELVVVGTSILRTVSKSTGISADPAEPGSPPDRCGLTLYDLGHGKELSQIDLAWFGPEIYDVLLLEQELDPLQLAVSAQLAERASIEDLRTRVMQQVQVRQTLSQEIRRKTRRCVRPCRRSEAVQPGRS